MKREKEIRRGGGAGEVKNEHTIDLQFISWITDTSYWRKIWLLYVLAQKLNTAFYQLLQVFDITA